MGRPTILLLTLVGALLFACTGVVLAQQERPTPEKAQTPATKGSQPEVVKGSFHVQWGDPPRRDPSSEAKTEYVLVDEEGKERKLRLDERDAEAVGGPRAFNGKRVEVKGTRVSDRPEHIDVETIDFERPEDAAKAKSRVEAGEPADAQALEVSAAATSKPWVTIGCKFKDSTHTLKERSYYDSVLNSTDPDTKPNIDHYWQEVSFGNINLDGSQVGGPAGQDGFWYTLPQPLSAYMSGTSPDLTKIATDCTAAADTDVNFRHFMGINLVLSDDIGCCAWGGSRKFSYDGDGQPTNYAVTWLPQRFASGHDWITHEMGHGFGLPHSSGPYSATYDSDWDVMSGSGECDEAKPNGVTALDGVTIIEPHPTYKCISVDTISYHADLLNWLTNRKYEVNTTGTYNGINIERLDQPKLDDPDDYVMAKIPIKGSKTQFYTVEARRLQGTDPYDGDLNGRIPGDAIVIHKVDTTLGDRNAKVVDSTRQGSNPNDAGAIWIPGETFTDKTNGITVKVVRENDTKTGYIVDIKRTR
jgi:M6 family metalloprotease-like protein